MMTGATKVYEIGRRVRDRNRMAGYVVPKEPSSNRPVLDSETVEKLLAVADRVSPLMALLMKLMDWTGRRLGSVRNLRWDDFDFEKKTIRWRAEHDKKRKTWVVPMPKEVERVLLEFRAKQRVIGSALVFPMRNDPNRLVSRPLAADWLRRGYRYAQPQRPKSGLGAPFPREFATEREIYPPRSRAHP